MQRFPFSTHACLGRLGTQTFVAARRRCAGCLHDVSVGPEFQRVRQSAAVARQGCQHDVLVGLEFGGRMLQPVAAVGHSG